MVCYIALSLRIPPGTPKPLIYEHVKHHFLEFAENITHHVLDDTTWRMQFSWHNGTTSTATGDVWANEAQHHQQIYRELPKQFAGWSDSDLVVYGDMDEMADEDLLLHLKHCELRPDVKEPINSNTGEHIQTLLASYDCSCAASCQ